MTLKTFRVEIESETQNLAFVRKELRSFLEQTGFPAKTLESILVAIGEACTNSIRHAYQGEKGHKIQVSAEDLGDKVVFKIRDYGQQIDLTKLKTPELPPKKGGGLGVYFMQTIMDELKYNTHLEQGNELVLTKHKEGERRP